MDTNHVDRNRQNDSEFEISDPISEGRDNYDMDIDRMVNEGLGGGYVTMHNGLIEETSTHTMGLVEEEVEEDVSDE